MTRLGWAGEAKQWLHRENGGSIFLFSGGKGCSGKPHVQNWRPLVMALSDEVHLGLPHSCTSHIPVVPPCTFPTSACGLLVGLSAEYYMGFYFSFCLISISFRLWYKSLFSCQSSCFKAMGLKLLGDGRGFSVIKDNSETAEFCQYFQSSL